MTCLFKFKCRTVRSSAAFALGKLSALSTRIDPLVGDLLSGLQVMMDTVFACLHNAFNLAVLTQLIVLSGTGCCSSGSYADSIRGCH